MVSDIGIACLMEVGYKSRWWARCNHVCENFGLWELVNLIVLNILNMLDVNEWISIFKYILGLGVEK